MSVKALLTTILCGIAGISLTIYLVQKEPRPRSEARGTRTTIRLHTERKRVDRFRSCSLHPKRRISRVFAHRNSHDTFRYHRFKSWACSKTEGSPYT